VHDLQSKEPHPCETPADAGRYGACKMRRKVF
jgi:hypothetical protein